MTQMQNILQEFGSMVCLARSILLEGYFIIYLLAFFSAGLYDNRFFSDYWRAQLNPFSINKYGVVAIVNLISVLGFFIVFLTAPLCK